MTERRPDAQIGSQLTAPIGADATDIPVLSLAPYRLDADKRIGEAGEFIRCSGMTSSPWPMLTGCQRGIRPEDGGVPKRAWDAGTMVFEVPWAGVVDVLDYIPVPTPEMVGRPFAYKDAQGNIYTFNVVVLQDTTLAIDWVNEPPTEPGADPVQLLATPRYTQENVVGIYPDAAGNTYLTTLPTIVNGADIVKVSPAYAVVWGNTFGGMTDDTFAHVWSDGIRAFWTARQSPDTGLKVASVNVGTGTPLDGWADFMMGVMPFDFHTPVGIYGDGATPTLWVVDAGHHRVIRFDYPNGGNMVPVSYIGRAPTWTSDTITAIGSQALTGVRGLASPDKRNKIVAAVRDVNRVAIGDALNPATGSALTAPANGSVTDWPYGVGVNPDLTALYVSYNPATGTTTPGIRRMLASGTETNNVSLGAATALAGSVTVDEDNNNVWVVYGNTIQKRFGTNVGLQSTIGTTAASATDGLFNTPTTIKYFDGAGATPEGLYVCDMGNNRVQKINPSTNAFISKITGYGPGNATPFSQARSLCVEPDGGYLYVLDYNVAGSQVHVYDRTHTWLMSIAMPTNVGATSTFNGMEITVTGVLWISDPDNNRIIRLIPTISPSAATGEFNAPTAITIGPGGNNLYVLDAGNGRVQKFDKVTHAWVATFDLGLGNADGQISASAEGIALDADGNIWICDTGNHRIQVYDATGVFLFKFGSLGSGENQFNNPRQISFNPTRTILWIADSGNDRVVTLQRVEGGGGLVLGANAYDWDEEYIGGGTTSGAIGERGWTFTGNGSVAVQPSTAQNPGLVRLNTGGSSGNKNRLTLGPWILPQIDTMTFIGFFAANGVATSVHQRMGLGAGTNHLDTFGTDNGVCVEYYDAASTAFLCVTSFIAGVANRTITAVPFVAAAPYMAEFEVTAPGEVTVTVTQLLPLGNGVKETVVKSGISQTAQFDATFAQRTGNGVSKFMDADYWSGSFSGLARA